MPTKTACIILAAGQGTRMRSRLPKVLHPLAEEPMIAHVVRIADAAGCASIVVVVSPSNHGAIEAALATHPARARLQFAVQAEPRGTGDAARAGMQAVGPDVAQVLVVCGDTPLLRPQTLALLMQARGTQPLAVLGARVSDPTGYGRLLRVDSARPEAGIARIVEHKDCSAAELGIAEINSGVYAVAAPFLREALTQLKPNNAQHELYLTDIVAQAATSGGAQAHLLADASEARGVNSRIDLGEVEMQLRRRLVAFHQAEGVSFVAPDNVLISPNVSLARDVTVGAGVQLLGHSRIESDVRIDGPSVIKDSVVQAGAHVRAFCHLEQAQVGEACQIGPYARLRPHADLRKGARAGNFVEIKNSTLQAGAKANHLAYIGDAEVGPGANIGAGTITCNYDGFHKHKTTIGANAFVGSNNTLVAPLEVGEGAITAAGSTLTEDVPADALAFGRARQANLAGKASALRKKLA